jgi:glucose/arabinose dehydrogenase
VVSSLVMAACSGGGAGSNVSAPVPDSGLAVAVVAQGLQGPLFLTSPPGDARLFIVEQSGRIRVMQDGQLLSTPFLDIPDLVTAGGERGLLGLAFHPAYASNGWFFVNYTDRDGNTRVVRYTVSANPNVADRGSAKTILSVAQPYGNHNGGHVAFGPDGLLYVGMGDGGSANDPHGHGQDRATLLGAMLRVDVEGGDPYAIPADNPYVGRQDAAPEIWAIGLRNPWRFSFDRDAGILYIGDVGQNAWEEIDVEPASAAAVNYGWRVMEGTHCFGSPICDREGLELPLVEYGHDNGCSVIGGYVYRGSALPTVQGHYFYADWCQGWVRSFRVGDGAVREHTEWEVGDVGNVLSFGEDSLGELYLLSQNGTVYRLVSR